LPDTSAIFYSGVDIPAITSFFHLEKKSKPVCRVHPFVMDKTTAFFTETEKI